MDLYNLLGIEPTASVSEIKKAYRKKALICHPDKNLNNPRAAELFQELSKALETLTDEKTRTAYDQVIAARKREKERVREFDAKRKKFKEDLEAREEAHKKTKSDEERLKAEIERLQKEGARLVEEEAAFMQKQMLERLHGTTQNSQSSNAEDFIIKIRWKTRKIDSLNGGYNHDNLHRMFSKYGDVIGLVLSSKKGRAMVEFENKSAAETALLEVGLAENPLTLRGLWDQKQSKKPSAPDIFERKMSDAEFEKYESSVLANLRRAEERQRLIEELKKEEEKEGI